MRRIQVRRPRKPAKCPLCVAKTEVHWSDMDTLRKFMSERGKILGRAHTGACNRHQKALSGAIKNARFLALLPYISRPL